MSDKWKGQDWINTTIPAHRKHYDSEEKAGFEYALAEYQGKHWTEAERKSRMGQHLVTFNILYAIVESAITALVPSNLQYTITAGGEDGVTAQYTRPELEKKLEKLARRGRWQDENVLALTDAILYGRYFFKVSLCEGKPTLRSVRPQNVYFDLTARRPTDIKYFIECTPYEPEAIQDKAKDGGWKLPSKYLGATGLLALKKLATNYPQWLSKAANTTAGQNWVMTYEVWDCKKKEYTVWFDGLQEPAVHIEGNKFWNPWVIGNLMYNGQDCAGLSEIQIIKDLTQAVNRFLTYMNTLVRKQVGTTLYDSTKVSQESVASIATSPPGAFVPVKVENGASIREAFYDAPMVQFTNDLVQFEQKLEQMISYVSALSDTARGQTVGAKTATELALIESQQRSRLAYRTNTFYRVCAEAASKALLMEMKWPIDKLPDLYESLELVASNAISNNRGVLQEKFQTIQAYLASRPDGFDIKELDKLFVEIFNLPESLILPTAPAVAPPAQPIPMGEEPIPPEAAQAIANIPPEILQQALSGENQ